MLYVPSKEEYQRMIYVTDRTRRVPCVTRMIAMFLHWCAKFESIELFDERVRWCTHSIQSSKTSSQIVFDDSLWIFSTTLLISRPILGLSIFLATFKDSLVKASTKFLKSLPFPPSHKAIASSQVSVWNSAITDSACSLALQPMTLSSTIKGKLSCNFMARSGERIEMIEAEACVHRSTSICTATVQYTCIIQYLYYCTSVGLHVQ